VLEDPWTAPPEDAFAWTAPVAARPAQPDEINVRFDAGVPSVNGATGASLVAWLNAVAGKHGVGRIDLVEDRVIGVKSREVYEAPAATVLIAAHKALERLTLTRDELRFKAAVDQKYAELAYDGLWTSPLRNALDAFNATIALRTTGDVRVRLHHGSATVAGVRSPFALYDQTLATYGADDAFDHHAAGGFIACYGLPLDRVAAVLSPSLDSAATPLRSG
jgi:argininosuccinate synthase